MNKSPTPKKKSDSRYNIRVLDRAFRIFSLLSDGKPRPLVELSEAISLSPSTTFRILSTLAYHKYIERDEVSNQYHLGLACLQLAYAFLSSSDLRKVSLPILEALRDETKETIHLAVLDQMEVVYLDKLPGLHAIGIMSSQVGGRAPSYCTGLGEILLAYQPAELARAYYKDHKFSGFTQRTITDVDHLIRHLEECRKLGYALDEGEHEEEVYCVATPIFDLNNQAVAALSISGPRDRMIPLQADLEFIAKAKQAAQNISKKLGFRLDQQTND
jgi:DNA-binding IclR family transcriptional regulator